MPEVSVIVTTYNRKEFLTETLNSILNQTFKDFELIVVDNFSNYDFLSHISSFNDKRIHPFQNQNDGIIAVNRNFGIKKAKGKYLTFCDDDDIWLPEKLSIQIKDLNCNKTDLVFSNTLLIFMKNGKVTNSNYYRINSINRLLFKNKITLSTVVVRNSKAVYFNEDKKLISIEDYDLWIKLMLSNFKFGFNKLPLIKYRVTDSSISRKSKKENEKINILFSISLFKKYKFSIFTKAILLYTIFYRTLRYLGFLVFNF